MALVRRHRTNPDIWPGFVDALATLLMVIIFLLMIFAVSQFYLSDALVGRDKALESLNTKMGELADLLDFEPGEEDVDMKNWILARPDCTQRIREAINRGDLCY